MSEWVTATRTKIPTIVLFSIRQDIYAFIFSCNDFVTKERGLDGSVMILDWKRFDNFLQPID